jgi:flagellar basal-body rod modification protein FlgD
VIDPIAAGPAATPSLARTPGGNMGKDEFLKLLVSQLRNQDPLNPSDPKDFAAQLAQFSTLEQLINIGDQLKAQADQGLDLITTINAGAALQLIGKNVIAEGDGVVIPDQGSASVRVDVAGSGGSGELVLRDEAGNEVKRVKLGSLAGGRQEIDLSQLVGEVPPGKYTYRVEVQDSAGAQVGVTTYAKYHIDSIKYTPNGPVLVSGPVTLPLGNVVEISE